MVFHDLTIHTPAGAMRVGLDRSAGELDFDSAIGGVTVAGTLTDVRGRTTLRGKVASLEVRHYHAWTNDTGVRGGEIGATVTDEAVLNAASRLLQSLTDALTAGHDPVVSTRVQVLIDTDEASAAHRALTEADSTHWIHAALTDVRVSNGRVSFLLEPGVGPLAEEENRIADAVAEVLAGHLIGAWVHTRRVRVVTPFHLPEEPVTLDAV